LRAAICDLYRRKFGVELDPETQAITTIGAKEGLAHLMWVLAAPGDTVLVPTPTYPIHRYAAVLTGAYVGEVLCLNGGARWSENTDVPLGPLRFELVTPDGGAAYPVLWALERLRGQTKASIVERARGVLTA